MKLDNTIKNILSSKEAETEYEELLSQSGLLNNDELKDVRTAILGDYINSSFHIRRVTKYANAIINQLMNNKDYKVKKTKVEFF
ncbi:hypothetical protein [Candidatus Pelagibacter sp. HIMB1746]|uniref:hypothetical protein n=1 Tax=Candidatus Pelagibacter sp. HIMB1746 TaxID=3413370 RepID=UPI003F8472F9